MRVRKLEKLVTLRWLVWVVAGSTLLAVFDVAASTSYPEAVKKYPYATNPNGECGWAGNCLLCHATIGGGDDTVTQAFGQALMKDFGLVGNDYSGDNSSIIAALNQIQADGLDVDGDGVDDLDELCGGGNPNNKAEGLGGAIPPVNPEYGCIGSIVSPPQSSNGVPLTFGLLASLAAFRLRRRR